MLAAALAVALGWQVPCAPLRAASECRARSIGLQLPTERTGDTFLAVIDLGEGDGTVTHEFRPYFSSSALITMRYPVPHVLEAEPIQGVIKVTKSGDGLFEGDVRRLPGSLRTAPHRLRSRHCPCTAVRTPPHSHAATCPPQVLRAFSTLEMRYDSAKKEVRSREGSFGPSLGPSPGPSLAPTPRPSPDASASHDPSLDPALTLILVLGRLGLGLTLTLTLTRCASARASSARRPTARC